MSFSGDGIELRDNIMDSNDSVGMLVVSNVLLCQIAGADCNAQPGYVPYAENIYIHDNTYINNGTAPTDVLAQIAILIPAWGGVVPNVVWDGYMASPIPGFASARTNRCPTPT